MAIQKFRREKYARQNMKERGILNFQTWTKIKATLF